MDDIASPEPNHHHWLTLSLSSFIPPPETQPQPQPPPPQEHEPNHQESYPLAPPLLPLFQTRQEQPSQPQLRPQLLETETEAEAEARSPPSLPALPQEQEPQESYTMAPPLNLPPPVHNLPEMLPVSGLNPPSQRDREQDQDHSGQSQTRRVRKRMRKLLSPGKTETIEPPFPWATTSRAVVHSLDYLLAHNIRTISGTVRCKKCKRESEIEFELKEKFREVARYFLKNNSTMSDRAPVKWMNPKLPDCKNCGEKKCVKPVINEKNKEGINWLFLFLGQMIGCCTMKHLKYFCKYNSIHHTGAKNRLLYATFLHLFIQLQPQDPSKNL